MHAGSRSVCSRCENPMIFFPSFAILILSMVLFSCCTYQEQPSIGIQKTQIASLVVMVSAFVVLMTDTVVQATGGIV